MAITNNGFYGLAGSWIIEYDTVAEQQQQLGKYQYEQHLSKQVHEYTQHLVSKI